jgi:hypothetical protein
MQMFIKWLLLGTLGILVSYLLVPSPSFPSPLPDSPQSREPGDMRDAEHFAAYFTNLSREEVMQHYVSEFRHLGVFGLIPVLRIRDYPPEEAFTHIADQTLSNYLEELIYPLRESLFVNGYQPGPEDDQIAFEGVQYKSKVTIRYYESNVFVRLLVVGLALGVVWWLGREYLLAWRMLWGK